MLYILFTAIFLIPMLLGISNLSERIFGKNIGYTSLKTMLGIMVLSVIWTVAAFLFPINFYAEVITLTAGLVSFFYFKNFNELTDFFTENKRFFIPALVVVLLAGSFYPFILDHFGYYVPTIKWIQEYGLVKGISNLDLLLGQMSVWHIFQAGFSGFADVFFRINTVLLIIYLIYILEKKSWVHLLFIPVLFLFSQSPSPDLPSIVFALIILDEILSGNKNSSFLFALSAFVFIIKPTMIWVPIFTFSYVFLILKEKPKVIIAGTLILILFLIKNLWTFGYPVFPVQIGDLGLPWKPNPESLRISSEVAIIKTFDVQFTIEEINKFSTFDFIKNWLTLKGLKSVIHIGFLISILLFGIFAFIKKKKIISFLFISILIKSVLVFTFSAQYRFFIDVFLVIAFVLLFEKISRKIAVLSFSALSLFFLSFLAFPNLVKTFVPSFKLGNFMLGFDKKQLIEPSHFELNQYKSHEIGNLKFNVVKEYPFSFDIPIPAISPQFLQEDYDAKVFPQKIGKDVKDGFIWRTMTGEEHQKLKNILEELKTKKP